MGVSTTTAVASDPSLDGAVVATPVDAVTFVGVGLFPMTGVVVGKTGAAVVEAPEG